MSWYYGPHKTKKDTFVVIFSRVKPTRESHGELMGFACGPVASRTQAINGARHDFYLAAVNIENKKGESL